MTALTIVGGALPTELVRVMTPLQRSVVTPAWVEIQSSVPASKPSVQWTDSGRSGVIGLSVLAPAEVVLANAIAPVPTPSHSSVENLVTSAMMTW